MSKIIYPIILIVAILSIFILIYKNNKEKEIQTENNSKYYFVEKIKDEDKYTTIDAEYPIFKNVEENFNKKIKDLILKLINDHKKESETNYLEILDYQNKNPQDLESVKRPYLPESKDKFPFYSKIEIYNIDKNYISFALRYGAFTGGANGYEKINTYNYDLKNKKEIDILNYFKNQNLNFQDIQKYTIKDLENNFLKTEEENDENYIKSIKEYIKEGTKNISDFSNFVFNENSLKFYFLQYQVGPRTFGLPEVVYYIK